MAPHWFNRLMAINAWIACVYAFFSAISLFGAPENLLVTQRHEYVFEHIAGRYAFGLLYTVIGIIAAYSVVHIKARYFAFSLISLISFFWAVIAIVPALLGAVSQGNLLGALSGLFLGLLTVSMAVLCHNQYNRV